MFGEKKFDQAGYPTPTSIPEDTSCLTINIPANDEWWSLVVGLLYSLILDFNWQQYEGGISREDAAARWQIMFEDSLKLASETNSCDAGMVQTPYWDTATDVEADETVEMQTWYGEVTNPTAPPGELTFAENILVWTFTGLIALATPELGFAPAILFHTIAPKFLIAQKAGDVGEIINIVVNGKSYAQVDTTGHAGEIMNTSIIGDASLDTQQLLIYSVPA